MTHDLFPFKEAPYLIYVSLRQNANAILWERCKERPAIPKLAPASANRASPVTSATCVQMAP